MPFYYESVYWNSDFKDFGLALKIQRKGVGLTQQELADLCGLDRTYICGLENGRRNPSLKTLMKLSDALKLPIPHLLTF